MTQVIYQIVAQIQTC